MKKRFIMIFRQKKSVGLPLLGRQLLVLLMLLAIVNISAANTYPLLNNDDNSVGTESADQQSVSGTVTDSKGEAIPGVAIREKGTTNGTVTDVNGNFSLSLQGSSPVLVFSFVGMVSQEITVGGQTQFKITMEADFIGIEEVVAVGYGTMKKSDVTGSVSSVTPEKLVDRPVVNVGQALQNKVAGVQVIRQAAGDPGGRPQIRIRGTNSINTSADPLFVVDGIVGVINALQNLNPSGYCKYGYFKRCVGYCYLRYTWSKRCYYYNNQAWGCRRNKSQL